MLGIQVGDPSLEVMTAWLTKDALRGVYASSEVGEASLFLDTVIASCEEERIPELRRLGRTLKAWRSEILAYPPSDHCWPRSCDAPT